MLLALHHMHVVDLIGQDMVGRAGFKWLARTVGHSRQLWQVRLSLLTTFHMQEDTGMSITNWSNIYMILCLYIMMDE